MPTGLPSCSPPNEIQRHACGAAELTDGEGQHEDEKE
jgi:hypothetical protein